MSKALVAHNHGVPRVKLAGGMEEMALEAKGRGGGQASLELLLYLLGFPVSVSGKHKSSVL